jgi:hypothetical protein
LKVFTTPGLRRVFWFAPETARAVPEILYLSLRVSSWEVRCFCEPIGVPGEAWLAGVMDVTIYAFHSDARRGCAWWGQQAMLGLERAELAETV